MTLKSPAAPTGLGDGKPVTTTVLAAAGLTTMPTWLPVKSGVVVSVTVSDCVPAVFSVTVKVWVPLSPAVKV